MDGLAKDKQQESEVCYVPADATHAGFSVGTIILFQETHTYIHTVVMPSWMHK